VAHARVMADKAPPKPPTPAQEAAQIAMLAGIAVAALNGLFYFAGGAYFTDKGVVDSARMNTAWIAFAVFTVTVAGASVVAAIKPKLVGHGIAAVAGVASLLGAIGAIARDMPTVLPVTMLILGGTLPALAYYSMQLRVRAAWSFLVALCGVFSGVLLFGAPKVRGVLGLSLWTALIIPGLLAVATIALSRVSADYASES
jgi:hypothetical protein